MGDSQKLRTVRVFLLIRTEQIKFFEDHGVQMQLRGVGEKQGTIFLVCRRAAAKMRSWQIPEASASQERVRDFSCIVWTKEISFWWIRRSVIEGVMV